MKNEKYFICTFCDVPEWNNYENVSPWQEIYPWFNKPHWICEGCNKKYNT